MISKQGFKFFFLKDSMWMELWERMPQAAPAKNAEGDTREGQATWPTKLIQAQDTDISNVVAAKTKMLS